MWDTWQAMCVTHGMPCVNMHDTLESYKYGSKIQFVGAVRSRRRKGKEKGRKGKEKGGERKGERDEKKRKGKKKREEERGGREEKERGKGCTVSIPRRKKTQNCATRGRFPPTLVILRPGAM